MMEHNSMIEADKFVNPIGLVPLKVDVEFPSKLLVTGTHPGSQKLLTAKCRRRTITPWQLGVTVIF